ncbi:MAG: purine-nucleoside phosphorylase [Oscillospiraceae bacterium]|nr:purine-nucleoside phosphorylase [Oscillospiraceae bacterium]
MTFDMYKEAADAIAAKIGGFKPEIALVLGSGLGFLGDECENAAAVPYGDVPHMKSSTAPGHKGQFVFGTLSGKRVAVMQGRVHTYEGYGFEDVTFAVRVLRLLGADKLIVTNACGGVNLDFAVGDIMVINDHIKLTGQCPLTGPNIPEFGTRFPDMSKTYTPALRELARGAAAKLGQKLREGVYMFFTGPQYETPAEIRAARVLGADTVGMSTVPEVIAARHAGMEILGFSLISNMAAGVLDQPLDEQEVLDAAAMCRGRFSALILKCLEDM